MSQYLDKYFPQNQPQSQEDGDIGGWAEEFLGDYEDSLGEDSFGLESQDEFGLEEEASSFEEEAPAYSEKQQGLIAWMSEHNPEILEKADKLQNRLAALQYGEYDANLEDKQDRLDEISDLLQELQSELATHDRKEKTLKESGILEEDVMADAVITEDLEKEIKNIEAGIQEEESKTKDALNAQETAETEAKAKEVKNNNLKDQFLDALGYLNGSKEDWLFSGKVAKSGRQKHIYKYHDHITTHVQILFADMGKAVVSGDWTSVKATFESLPPGDVDNTLTLSYAILEKYPDLLNNMPSEVLTIMADRIQSGNDPNSDRTIWRIAQGEGKADDPKNHRHREGLHNVGLSGHEAAAKLRAQAEINQANEPAEGVDAPESSPPEAEAPEDTSWPDEEDEAETDGATYPEEDIPPTEY